jgi:hypothetical protein
MKELAKASFGCTCVETQELPCSWSCSSTVWGGWRLVCGLYLLALNLYSIVASYQSRGYRAVEYYYTSLTHWALTFEALYFLLAAALTLSRRHTAIQTPLQEAQPQQQQLQPALGLYPKLVWFCQVRWL